MKFYEVMSQIVLPPTLSPSTCCALNLKTWNSMSPAKQKSFQASVDKALAWSTQEHLKKEAELADSFKKAGLEDQHAGRQRVPRVCTEGIPRFRRGEGLGAGNPGQDAAVK